LDKNCPKVKPKRKEVKTMEERFYIAGFKFHQGVIKVAKDKISKGDVVTLVPAPNNPYDENAIEVHHDGDMIGFVPKAVNQNLIPFFDGLDSFPGELIKVDKEAANAEPWKAIKVLIQLVQPDKSKEA
jgi:hypothetical protein